MSIVPPLTIHHQHHVREKKARRRQQASSRLPPRSEEAEERFHSGPGQFTRRRLQAKEYVTDDPAINYVVTNTFQLKRSKPGSSRVRRSRKTTPSYNGKEKSRPNPSVCHSQHHYKQRHHRRKPTRNQRPSSPIRNPPNPTPRRIRTGRP